MTGPDHPAPITGEDLEVPAELWYQLAPLLPDQPQRRRGPGPARRSNRQVLNGIVYVLASGIGWAKLPSRLGYGSGMTCWRRLREWTTSGAWQQILPPLQEHYGDWVDWQRPTRATPPSTGATRPGAHQ